MQSWWVHLANEPGFEITDWDAANNMPTESSETTSLCTVIHCSAEEHVVQMKNDRKIEHIFRLTW